MPDYFPQIQLPEGLAAETARLASQQGQPWAQLAASLGQDVSRGIQNYRQRQADKPLTPEQLTQIKAGQIPAGMPRSQQLAIASQQASLAERMQASKEATNRALLGKQMGLVDISQDMIDQNPDLKKKGIVPGMYPSSFASTLMKTPTGAAATKDQDDANRQIVTDYAAKHGISLDALRPGGMGGWNSPNLAMAAKMIKDHPDYDPAAMKVQFAGQMAGAQATARTTAGQSAEITTQLGSAHGALVASLDQAKGLADKMSQGDFASFNKAWQAGKRQFNSPDAIQLSANLQAAAYNWARLAKGGKGGVSDEDMRHADKIISEQLDSGGIEAIEKAAETEYQGRLKGLPGWEKKASAKGVAGIPKVGSVENGYKFKGGDPSKPENWEKQ